MGSLSKKSLLNVLYFMYHSRMIISHIVMCLEVTAIYEMYNSSSIKLKVQYSIIPDC